MRIGGVPEHFNLPWQEVLADRTDEWVEFGGGSGAMARALASGELDVAVMLTESAVRAISKGLDAKIVGTHVHSPLRWGIHRSATSDVQLTADARFAISRFGSGSHLIPCVLAEQRGWDVAELTFVEIGTIAGGRDALLDGRADLFFWEQFMTQPLVDAGDLDRIDVFLPAWPSFVVVASAHASDVQELIAAVGRVCASKQQDAEGTAAAIVDRFGIQPAHADEWLMLTDWRCTATVSTAALGRAAHAIEQAFGEPVDIDALVDARRCELVA